MVEERPRTLADKLNHLFATIHPGGRGPYSNTEVAAGIVAMGGSITDAYIGLLRSGKRSNPTYNHLKGLAEFFGVSVNYFFDDEIAAKIDSELELVVAMRDNDVLQIALRSKDLTPQNRSAILTIIDQIRQMQGLPPAK
ncbi:transcriptional regulator with XRE-family HTH domain [Thermocatellispora tengchongensis]|uniref:Transcriptional regulator with XRE-family HTH domain n=1 Tax=Thermocatellispora tengchongensis TaxID=1073253 RepID=A0A840PGS1_9ACTN|nr:helix-turn-helix domain-containing protein [Thermocatellispora tengchongensis]MBB5136700.1 transcriptional regulator with XRE-family HTH domain [Thermocatellispora tengchongensis]